MKTATIIVRLIGLYLAINGCATLIQIHRIEGLGGNIPNPVSGDITIYALLGLVVGLLLAALAGPIAKILTFDAGRE